MTSTTVSLVPPRPTRGARGTTPVRSRAGERRKTLRLDTGSVIRIVDGGGMRLTATSGVVWITEEGRLDDFVLLPGDSHRIANAGLTLVLAHRAARVRMAVPSGTFLPRRMDVARADGTAERRVAFSGDYTVRLRMMRAAIVAAYRKAIVAARELVASRSREARPTDVPFPHH
jgi:Protein of unknown function (DUF2917)